MVKFKIFAFLWMISLISLIKINIMINTLTKKISDIYWLIYGKHRKHHKETDVFDLLTPDLISGSSHENSELFFQNRMPQTRIRDHLLHSIRCCPIHGYFASKTFLSNTRLSLAYFETRILEYIEIWTMRPFQNDCTHSK